MTSKTIPCLRCEQPFELPRRGRPAKYCHDCRAEINRENMREKSRQMAEDRATLRAAADALRPYLDPSMLMTLDQYIEHSGGGARVYAKGDSLVVDRMPEGSNSPGGPDDGTSTTNSELSDFLDRRRMDVIMHDWFAENPHWAEGMHEAA